MPMWKHRIQPLQKPVLKKLVQQKTYRTKMQKLRIRNSNEQRKLMDDCTLLMTCQYCKHLLFKDRNWFCFISYSDKIKTKLLNDIELTHEEELNLRILNCRRLITPLSYCGYWETKEART